ncbi:peptidase inhibitor family I36 protein [Streptomyces sp. NRRL S-350]|uniref:peptidase inhibitor family I36 protein n=1 Tax=Streptomyces sp. NRRL S-350 TaxID=1463902 RepID=UPI0004BE98C8|nr:peptidase inhibitor family I36 protein [Streptomyces sp. NRRL S-350]
MVKFHTMAACLSMAAGLALTAAASSAVAAPAATGYDRCASGNFCLFQDIDGQGRVVGLGGERASLGSLDFDNITSSLRNRTGRVWSVYTNVNFGGRCLPVAADYTGNVTQYSMNDQISSARPGGCPS